MKISYYSFVGLWLITFSYAIYKFVLGAGYWGNPLKYSFLFFAVAIIVNNGLNKVLTIIIATYLFFGLSIIYNMIRSFPAPPN
ncbi:hypothetical protein JOC33_000585 [Thalassobacillus pellis]|nr:hypothetical protein [Thalassobacillus pellis]